VASADDNSWYTSSYMAFEDFETKESVVLVYTGEGKGKTSASLGLMTRALGNRWNVAYIQFIKYWGVGEHAFIRDITPLFKDQLYFYKGGKGFYNANDLSPTAVTDEQHKQAAQETYAEALKAATSGDYDLVICDELSNSVHDGLVTKDQLQALLEGHSPKTSLCITGRDFPEEFLHYTDIATNMIKIKHHFDDKFLANKGIDY
jgi:cob(I)alamin adenosyltransferase